MTNVESHIAMLKEISAKDPLYQFLDPGFMSNVYLPFVSARTPSAELRGRPADVVA